MMLRPVETFAALWRRTDVADDIVNRIGNRSGQSDFPTRSRPRFPVSDRVRTLRSILIAGSDPVCS